ncbi:MAG: 5'-nucleotidase C-terminal domain-containing protein, partial [Anaerolineae bacterium]|nr:5'-nucleotidase C-terminal domain-containing protein [Anaerolineae bacterium]
VMNLLGYDAMTLGNHEFDNGTQILADFIAGLNFPVVVSNIDVSEEPLLADKVQEIAILEVGGEQIGVIGLVTAETDILSSPGENVTFNADYVAVVNAAAATLTEQGVNKIIVLTHTGYNVDVEVIPQLENVDIYIGGHSHSLFGNQNNGAVDAYPVVIESKTGPVYYGQAGEKNTYLGRLNVEFDKDGIIVSTSGDTIFLSHYITPDAEALELVSSLDAEVVALREQSINATTDIMLVGERTICRVEECLLGNLIADGMRAETGAQIAIMNSGGIRASIEAGDITLGEVLTVQPFGNLMSTFSASGADVIAALENGVSSLVVADGVVGRADLAGRFPQVSGIRYSFDPNLEAGSRITGVDVLNEDGTYSPIDPVAVYTVVTNNFMRNGGDGYSVLATNAIAPYDFGLVDYDVFQSYLVSLGTVTADNVKVEGRITMVNATVAPLE